ncbi:hypothetical protein GCM10011611_62710 [Aliidongia dinghuensis]|uniref:Porin n=1 Tax=Aliidongia dinghuensis TaxID=1867774 RepID=A0A8J3E7Q7_9PROT|nr:putative porin [Aliidongia dinghuensis]GGF47763.1 hypothetical protein GCM10011611_62710 [Aliidongia dinghuensis]
MALLLCTTAVMPLAFAANPAAAQTAPAGSDLANAKLLDLLVKRKILSRAEANELLKEASGGAQATPAKRAAPTAPAAVAAAGAATGAVAGNAVTTTPPADGAVHVTYVPEIVKKQLRDEIKQEVMAQAKDEHWAAPGTFPDWVSRLHVYGDMRARYEGDFFPSGNDNTGGHPNFNAINTGSPYDTSRANQNFPPQLNVDQERNRFRIRARLGVDADLGDGFSAGIRLASGENDSPVSENQTLGNAGGGQGGDFAKYAVWLDRAFITYAPWQDEQQALSVTVGRFDNPFFATNLLWADDLSFDGAAVSGKYEVVDGVTPFFTVGAFPVFNTDFNFATNQPAKTPSRDKWLYAAQAGADWKIDHDSKVKLGAAYYDFQNLEGRTSSPCIVNSSADSCDTDDTRPSFAQNGNTYFPLRNIVATSNNNFGTTNQLQYFGLATPFRDVAVTGRYDFSHFDPIHLWFDAEFVKNLAFNRADIASKAINNRAGTTDGSLGAFEGGDSGYYINLSAGAPTMAQRWDWNVNVGYKYLESDAVPDAFTDSDFGLGGTNLKGYIVGGNLALSKNVWTRLRWLSADNISGSPFKTDVVQLDLNARF